MTLTLQEQHLIALPDNWRADYFERCAIDAGNGEITDEVREVAFQETLKMIYRNKRKR